MLLYARGKTFEPASECHALARHAARRHVPGADIVVRQMNEARGRKKTAAPHMAKLEGKKDMEEQD
jgi:hypothetical protein